MHQLRSSLQLLRNLDIPRTKFCITGSSALALWSEIAVSRGYAPLFNREAGDVDVNLCRTAFADAVHHINLSLEHKLGLDDCLNLDLGESSLDLTRQWPTLLVDTTDSIEHISSDILGFRVMDISYIAALKQRFNRPKDRADLRDLDQGLYLH